MKKTSVIVLFTFLSLTCQPVLAATVQAPVLGEVMGKGKAEVLVFGNNWSQIKGSYPVFAESRYRTWKGTLSFLIEDGSRIEMGSNSELIIGRETGNYSVLLMRGEIAFNVAEGSILQVKTPEYIVETTGNAVGGISCDGKYTTVKSVSGQQKITTLSGKSVLDLSGRTVVLASGGSVVTAMAVEGALTGVYSGSLPFLSILAVGGVVAVAGMSDGGGDAIASPSAPE